MIAIDIKDKSGKQTNHWEGDSASDGQAWIEQNKSAFPDGYTVAQSDITQDRADEAAIEQGLKYQAVGARAIAMLTAVNLQKSITASQLTTMAANQQLMLAINLIGNGALKTGRDIFLGAGAAFYSADEMARIVKPINDSGLVV